MSKNFDKINISSENLANGLFPKYINSQPIDLEKISIDDGLKENIIEKHNNYNIYNKLQNIENLSDYKEFINKKQEKWENSNEAIYYAYNSYDLVGYCALENINWEQNSCDIKIYIPSEKIQDVNKILDCLLYIAFYNLNLNVVHLLVGENESVEDDIKEYIEEVGEESGKRDIYTNREYYKLNQYTIRKENL